VTALTGTATSRSSGATDDVAAGTGHAWERGRFEIEAVQMTKAV